MKYYVIAREDKTVLKEYDNIEKAELDMCQRVRQDLIDGGYEPEYYAIVDEKGTMLDCQ